MNDIIGVSSNNDGGNIIMAQPSGMMRMIANDGGNGDQQHQMYVNATGMTCGGSF